MLIGYNKCEWLTVGNLDRCGASCVNRLCGAHRARLRRSKGSEPKPCRRCGRGTKSETVLCSKECGSDRGKKALKRAEAPARRAYARVLDELLRLAKYQQATPSFIGPLN